MLNIITYISFLLIICPFIGYFILIFINRKNIISKLNGFDISKDIINEYNSINIVESKKYLSYYNIKRKVIKLDSKTYYGKDLSSISISLIEAGICILHDNKNNFITTIGKIISNIKLLYILPLLSIVLNFTLYSNSDVTIGIILMILFNFIMFMLIDIKTNVYNWLCDDLNKIKEITKDNKNKILKFINLIINLDKLILLGEVIIIIKYIMILLGLE